MAWQVLDFGPLFGPQGGRADGAATACTGRPIRCSSRSRTRTGPRRWRACGRWRSGRRWGRTRAGTCAPPGFRAPQPVRAEAGSYVAFARTKAQRQARGRPRAVRSRSATRTTTDMSKRWSRAAKKLMNERFPPAGGCGPVHQRRGGRAPCCAETHRDPARAREGRAAPPIEKEGRWP